MGRTKRARKNNIGNTIHSESDQNADLKNVEKYKVKNKTRVHD